MRELDDAELESVAAGKMPRNATEATLAAWADLARSLRRDGNRIGDTAEAIRKRYT